MKSTSHLPPAAQELLAQVEKTISRYQLCASSDRIVLALSGGKDSLTALLLLHSLGYNVHAVAVDMGYDPNWGSRLSSYISSLGFTTTVLSARDAEDKGATPEHSEIPTRLRILRSAGTQPGPTFTPCTHCYSVKALLLHSFARNLGASKVVFGHHASDAAASLTKEALMHFDRWVLNNPGFCRARFGLLVEELRKEADSYEDGQKEGDLLSALRTLVAEGQVDTDEPPRQPLCSDETDVEILRPLFDCHEQRIHAASRALRLKPEPSGCGHGSTKLNETPRQMVHRALFDTARPRLQSWLHHRVTSTIDSFGSGKIKARLHRAQLLGIQYKPTTEGLEKV